MLFAEGGFLVAGPLTTAASLSASGSAWGAIRRNFLRIVTPAGPKSAINCGARRQPYSPKARWISYPCIRSGDLIFRLRRIDLVLEQRVNGRRLGLGRIHHPTCAACPGPAVFQAPGQSARRRGRQ